MESRYHHVTGLVLKHYALGENDRRVYILTPDLGKIAAKARGAKKLTSPFTSRLSPLNVCNMLLYKTPGNSWTITQCQTEMTYRHLQANLTQSSIALGIVDIAYRCTEEGHPSHQVYNLTIEALRILDTLESESKSELLFAGYQLQIFEILGVLPSFSSCIRCHKKIDIETLEGWHPLEILCVTCLGQMNHLARDRFDTGYLKLLNFIKKHPLSEILTIKISETQQKEINRILQLFWNAQTFSVPKSLDVLASLRA